MGVGNPLAAGSDGCRFLGLDIPATQRDNPCQLRVRSGDRPVSENGYCFIEKGNVSWNSAPVRGEADVLQVRDLVDAQLYRNDQEVIQDALRYLVRGRPDLRVRLAIHRYQTESISLAKAASLAGVSWAQMKEILVAHGIEPRLGPETLGEAEQEVQALRGYFEAQA